MTGYQSIVFHEALEMVESLSYTQQENLIEIIRRRLIDARREAISRNVKAAREEYARGDTTTGTVDELMAEIDR